MSQRMLPSTARALSLASKRRFVATVWQHYAKEGRHHLPWRRTKNPYRILVSEVMLQQTQVDRVLPKYRAFVRRYPTAAALARAPLGDVLRLWQGLGYNRRAKLLRDAACIITEKRQGRFPRTYEELVALPGVGPYTASAVMAFAFNAPVVLIETNIRTVFLHHFFNHHRDVSDHTILPIVAATLPHQQSRDWYAALMDYGTHLKRTVGNVSQRSASYVRQSTFKGSDRQIRGAIVRVLAVEKRLLSPTELCARLGAYEASRVATQLDRLLAEGLVVRRRRKLSLPHE
jgi:A/G-specific adenine glycosylase